MYFKTLFLVSLIVFQTLLSLSSSGVAHAQIDLTDEEAEVEEPDSDSAVVGSETYTSDEEEVVDTTLKASPDADTTFIFTKPAGLKTEIPAGKDIHFLVGFANKGSKDLVIESMDASFRYPLDFSYHIQNFSTISYQRTVKPKQDVSLHYVFYSSESLTSRPFGLVVNLLYKDVDGRQYADAVFNETVTIVEVEESLDGETFFLYILLAAGGVLILVVAQQFLVNFTKKKISSGPKIETGTQNHQNNVDYDWLPKETLNDFNKSPRRSERLSPRKSKQSDGEVSPQQSPKQPVQRKVKRGG